jgi:hypothetical protein
MSPYAHSCRRAQRITVRQVSDGRQSSETSAPWSMVHAAHESNFSGSAPTRIGSRGSSTSPTRPLSKSKKGTTGAPRTLPDLARL